MPFQLLGPTQPAPPAMKLIDAIAQNSPEIATLRRDIHAHPELCFKEVRTADVVAQKLTEWASRSIAV